MRRVAIMLCCCLSFVHAASDEQSAEASLAWLSDNTLRTRAQPAQRTAAQRTPLGSLWKLYVYAYLAQSGASEAAYVCSGTQAAATDEQAYCCAAGESITRDQALARSCSAYFEPQRLAVTPQQWRAFWSQYAPPSATWLTDLRAVRPSTEVSVAELLTTLQNFPQTARDAARNALAEVTLSGYARAALPQLGSGPRMKTFTWHRPERPDTYFGGAAGWLADGTPFWFGASGSSRSAITRHAAWIAANLPQAKASALDEQACVVVDYFTRYPIAAVQTSSGEPLLQSARLNGTYVVKFVNGTQLPIRAAGELEFILDARPVIQGRLPLEDYVARVIDREADGSETEAGRALAVLARSYLIQNARFESGCYRISDSSNTQRVSPRPPSDAAVAAARFTDGLILSGQPVRYHRDQAAAGQWSWRDAVEQANTGAKFDALLAQTFPRASFATLSGLEECRPLAGAQQWLNASAAAWQRALAAEPGFEAVTPAPLVCELNHGNPYSDQRRSRIYARGWRSVDERITLLHEYLHLAFRFHPRGFDEAFIETTARRLIQG